MNTEARSSIDNLLSTLRESLAQPGQSMIPLLTSMSRFAKYSLANQMLIFAQRPDATCVQGYRAWNKAGYQVRKGEHGIAIYAPMLFANKRDTVTTHVFSQSGTPSARSWPRCQSTALSPRITVRFHERTQRFGANWMSKL